MREIPVVFEDDFCVVLNKPSGLPVQGGEGIKTSLDSILSEKYSPRPLLVHRLDKDTSGLILVAKTREAAAGFSALFAGSAGPVRKGEAGGPKNGRAVLKQYLGVCSGVPESASGVIRIGLDVPGKGGARVRESETFFRVLSSGSSCELPCSLLELELGTGRMHQIRGHLSLSGFPLLGDDKYGDFSLNKKLRKTPGLKHLLLHASRLVIPPVPGLAPRGLDAAVPPPDYFSRFLELLTATPHFQ